ncbi:hypothetical protein ACFSTC_53415 [Nonomuraea ferruginea]
MWAGLPQRLRGPAHRRPELAVHRRPPTGNGCGAYATRRSNGSGPFFGGGGSHTASSSAHTERSGG